MIGGFTAESTLEEAVAHPSEDAFSFDEQQKKVTLAVADGVTRDWAETLDVFDEIVNYPSPSPAKEAADLFCEQFTKATKASTTSILQAFAHANKDIRAWNNAHIPSADYLTKDFAGCVAAGAVVHKKKLLWSYIADCGICVFNAEGIMTFKTPDDGPEAYEEAIWSRIRKKLKARAHWNFPEARRMLRKEFRNTNKKPSFGVLTGEPQALKYVRTGTLSLKSGDTVIVFSDGITPLLEHPEFGAAIRLREFERLQEFCEKNVKYEGTVVYYLVP